MTKIPDEGSGIGRPWALISGAIVGAAAACFLNTTRGRQMLEAAVETLDDFSLECVKVCQAIARAQIAAVTSWDMLQDAEGRAAGRGRERRGIA